MLFHEGEWFNVFNCRIDIDTLSVPRQWLDALPPKRLEIPPPTSWRRVSPKRSLHMGSEFGVNMTELIPQLS